MKITFILPNWVGNLSGGMQSNITLAYHLKKRGHQVCLFCCQKSSPTLKKQIKSLLKGKGLISKRSDFSYLDGVEIEGKIVNNQSPLTDEMYQMPM